MNGGVYFHQILSFSDLQFQIYGSVREGHIAKQSDNKYDTCFRIGDCWRVVYYCLHVLKDRLGSGLS